MSYLPDETPGPQLNQDDEGFWRNCDSGHLAFQCCAECGFVQHPPLPLCPHCHSSRLAWKAAPEVGEIFSYTITHHASHPSMQGSLPYNIIIVQFPELGDVRLVSNLIDCTAIEIGMKVRLIWEKQGGRMFPRFKTA